MKHENQNHLILKIIDFNIHPNELTKKLGLEPTRTALKGERKYQRHIPESRNQYDETGPFTVWHWNYWEYQVSWTTNDWIITQFGVFLEMILKPRMEIMAELSKNCDIIISIVQYYYDNHNPGFLFDNDSLRIVYEIGASLDVDVYCLSE